MSVCRDCNQPLLWVKSEATGTPMPLDPEPSRDGNVYVSGGAGKVLSDDIRRTFIEEVGEPLHVSHHKTCPRGRSWQRRNRRQEGLF